MDSALRNAFNSSLKTFFEPLEEGGLELSLADGVVFRDLRVKPSGLNQTLEKQGVDVRVEGGRVGQMRVLFTPLPGTVTLQMSDVDIRVRPNAAKTVGKAILKGINDLFTSGVQMNSECLSTGRRIPPGPVYYYPRDGRMVQYHEDRLRCEPANVCCLGGPVKRRPCQPPLKTLPSRSEPLPLGSLPQAPPYGRRAHLIRRSHPRHQPTTGDLDHDCPDCWAEEHGAPSHTRQLQGTGERVRTSAAEPSTPTFRPSVPPRPNPAQPNHRKVQTIGLDLVPIRRIVQTNGTTRPDESSFDSHSGDCSIDDHLHTRSPTHFRRTHYGTDSYGATQTLSRPYQVSRGELRYIERGQGVAPAMITPTEPQPQDRQLLRVGLESIRRAQGGIIASDAEQSRHTGVTSFSSVERHCQIAPRLTQGVPNGGYRTQPH